MINKRFVVLMLALVVVVAGGFALSDAIGMFNSKGYTAVSHGSHFHYVPDDRDPDVSISRFPTSEPLPGEIITPTGQIIQKEDQ